MAGTEVKWDEGAEDLDTEDLELESEEETISSQEVGVTSGCEMR